MPAGFRSGCSFKRSRLRALLGGAVATVATVIALLPAVAQADVVGTHLVTPQTVAPHVVTPAPVPAPAPAPVPASPSPVPAASPEPAASAPVEAGQAPAPGEDPHPGSKRERHPTFPTPPKPLDRPANSRDSLDYWTDPFYQQSERAYQDAVESYQGEVSGMIREWIGRIVNQVLTEGASTAPELAPVLPTDPSGSASTGIEPTSGETPSPESDGAAAAGGDAGSSGGGHWRNDDEDPVTEQN
jgi:hypothetical protein